MVPLVWVQEDPELSTPAKPKSDAPKGGKVSRGPMLRWSGGLGVSSVGVVLQSTGAHRRCDDCGGRAKSLQRRQSESVVSASSAATSSESANNVSHGTLPSGVTIANSVCPAVATVPSGGEDGDCPERDRSEGSDDWAAPLGVGGSEDGPIVCVTGEKSIPPVSMPQMELDFNMTFDSPEAAQKYVMELAIGHGFCVKKTGGEKRTKAGELKRFRIGCAFSGTPEDCCKQTRKWKCPFRVTVLRVWKDGAHRWMFGRSSSRLGHRGHSFGAAVAAFTGGTRLLPDPVKAFVRGLRVDRIAPDSVITLVKERFPGTWITTEMVTSLWRVTDEETLDDVERLLKGGSRSFKGSVMKDANGVLTGAFWLCLEARDALVTSHSVILCDATYKTNRYKMPLILLSGTDNAGLTFPIAAAAVERENRAAYKWVFEVLCSSVRTEFNLDIEREVQCIVTDKDAAECEAVEAKFGKEKHVLCLFHMFRNVDRNLAGVLREDFSAFLSDFRDTIFSKTPEILNERIAGLCRQYTDARQYLMEHVFDSKEKFCYAYIKQRPTLGNRTTGRAENLNWLLKRRCRGSSSLTQVIGSMGLVVQSYLDRREKVMIKHAVRRSLVADVLERSLRDLLPGHLCTVVLKEVHRATNFPHVAYQREEGDWACTCGFFRNRLLPCRHIYEAKRVAVDIFTGDDLNPLFQYHEKGMFCPPGSGPPLPAVPEEHQEWQTTATGGGTVQEKSAGSNSAISMTDLNAAFKRCLDCVESSSERRGELLKILDGFVNESMKPPSGSGESGKMPRSRRGKGRASTVVKHNGQGGHRYKRPRKEQSAMGAKSDRKRRRIAKE